MTTFLAQDHNSSQDDAEELEIPIEPIAQSINPILCNHCGRTKDNGIRCIGICVADDEY